MRGLILLFSALALISMVGCGSSDTIYAPSVNRPPVLNQETENDNIEGNPTYSPIGQWILFESGVSLLVGVVPNN